MGKESTPSALLLNASLRVIVGSENPTKMRSVEDGLRQVREAAGSSEQFQVSGFKAASGVPDQPFGEEETHRGAYNRAKHTMEAKETEGDLFVGLEVSRNSQNSMNLELSVVCLRLCLLLTFSRSFSVSVLFSSFESIRHFDFYLYFHFRAALRRRSLAWRRLHGSACWIKRGERASDGRVLSFFLRLWRPSSAKALSSAKLMTSSSERSTQRGRTAQSGFSRAMR